MEHSVYSIAKYFTPLEDPRILLKTSHKLIDVIVIAIVFQKIICTSFDLI